MVLEYYMSCSVKFVSKDSKNYLNKSYNDVDTSVTKNSLR